ncbi:class IV adenylate cyclase [Vibrio splendidus]|uniref:class IV adenylate cyclase n=1 Tax=Vibrio splendidus TaxID=29497 RepID=UPI000C82982E|nr:class IV adenylate cyclase [Vibrio splendidus]MCC5515521.1 class IV adenylate cyclase [Vibrio splendidus]MCQ8866860.1 class IV adenylate cyclase [Vibrio splendidus]PMG65803.1 adenylate cyclase [Vibrio splendidus]PMN75370.1 adenylate cyclase [Vibrio splendidus]PTP86955.1 class IV adenylate cyclase [Vibrio splendidus]
MTNDHFKGKYEVELKYRLSSKSEFLKTLNLIAHEVMLQDNQECDWYFDSPDRSLQAQNKSLCIRTMEPSGIKLWIVKGPESDRCEATNITDASNAKSMLENLGYEVILKAQKTRSIYFVGEFHITVDSLAGIGDFAEFAIMTDDESKLSVYKSELELLANKFGLTESELQTQSYKQMFEEMNA